MNVALRLDPSFIQWKSVLLLLILIVWMVSAALAYYPFELQITCCVYGIVNGDSCICFAGWTGIHCHLPICSLPCNNGVCIAPNECRCKDGWEGPTCDTPAPQTPTDSEQICTPGGPVIIDPQRCKACASHHRCCNEAICFHPESHVCTSEGSVCASGEDSCNGRCFDTNMYRCTPDSRLERKPNNGSDKVDEDNGDNTGFIVGVSLLSILGGLAVLSIVVTVAVVTTVLIVAAIVRRCNLRLPARRARTYNNATSNLIVSDSFYQDIMRL